MAVRTDRSEAPLVGLVRRLYLRAPAGEEHGRGGQGCARFASKGLAEALHSALSTDIGVTRTALSAGTS